MNITVEVSELYQLAKEMLNDGMDYVKISYMEADKEEGLPACLHFDASRKSNPAEGIDYKELEDIRTIS